MNYRRAVDAVVAWLSSRTAVAAAQVVAIVALGLSLVVTWQYQGLTRCLASYNDDSARSLAARTAAAAEDRKADEADRIAAQRERDALQGLIVAIATQDRVATTNAFVNLSAVYQDTARVRAETAKTRAANEEARKANPPPPPPSLRCD